MPAGFQDDLRKGNPILIIVQGIHKLSDILDKVMEVVIVFMLGAMVVITGAQIVCRIFFTSLAWSEEATRYLLIWSTGNDYHSSQHSHNDNLCDLIQNITQFMNTSNNNQNQTPPFTVRSFASNRPLRTHITHMKYLIERVYKVLSCKLYDFHFDCLSMDHVSSMARQSHDLLLMICDLSNPVRRFGCFSYIPAITS